MHIHSTIPELSFSSRCSNHGDFFRIHGKQQEKFDISFNICQLGFAGGTNDSAKAC
jgi:hypothetical protein